MHSRVCPSTVQVMVVVPFPAGRTTPSPEMVATLELPMLQVGVEEVPLTRMGTEASSILLKVKSVWFREREAEDDPEPLPELPEEDGAEPPKVHRTVQV